MVHDGKSSNKYRPGVAIVVVNDQWMMLACHRSDIPGAWQIPQGGKDPGETSEQAALRELKEEIGTADVELLWHLPETIRYDWPEKARSRGFIGQEHTYFVARLKPNAKIDLQAYEGEQEFDDCKWLSVKEFLALNVGFKSAAYRRALELICKQFPQMAER